MRAAENEAPSIVAVVVRIGVEEVRTADARPAGRTLPAFGEEREAAALDVKGNIRVVGGG